MVIPTAIDIPISTPTGLGKAPAGGQSETFGQLLEDSLQEGTGQRPQAETEYRPITEQQPEQPSEYALVAIDLPVQVAQYTQHQEPPAVQQSATLYRQPPQQAAAPVPEAVPVQQQAQAQPEGLREEPLIAVKTADTVGSEQTTADPQQRFQTHNPEREAQTKFDRMVAQAKQQLAGEAITEQPDLPEAETTHRAANTQQPQAQDTQTEQPDQTLAQAVPAQTTVSAAQQAQPAAQTNAPVFEGAPAEQVSRAVLDGLESERREFEMQLRPRELGTLNVKMTLEGGKLAIQIMAATSQAAETLSRQSEGLAASLRLAGIQLESVQIVQQPTAGSELGQQGGQSGLAADQGESNDQNGQPGKNGESRAATSEGQPDDTPQDIPNLPESLLDKAV